MAAFVSEHSIHRIPYHLRELDRMIPDTEARYAWYRKHCGYVTQGGGPHGETVLPMTEEGMQEIHRFRKTRPHLRRGANLVPWSPPPYIFRDGVVPIEWQSVK